jgi:hypothetical protein
MIFNLVAATIPLGGGGPLTATSPVAAKSLPFVFTFTHFFLLR